MVLTIQDTWLSALLSVKKKKRRNISPNYTVKIITDKLNRYIMRKKLSYSLVFLFIVYFLPGWASFLSWNVHCIHGASNWKENPEL